MSNLMFCPIDIVLGKGTTYTIFAENQIVILQGLYHTGLFVF